MTERDLAIKVFSNGYHTGNPVVQQQMRAVARTIHEKVAEWNGLPPLERGSLDEHVFRAVVVLPGSSTVTLRDVRDLVKRYSRS